MAYISPSEKAKLAEVLIAGIRDELAKIRELEESLMERKKEMIVALSIFRETASAEK